MESKLKLNLFSIIFIINFVTIFSFNLNFNDLKQFLNKEKSILDSFDKYLSSEENRIFRLRQTYERFRQQNSIALKDKELFLSHPNDVYFLIKRITIEWKAVEESLEPIKPVINELMSRIVGINVSQYNFKSAVEGYDYLMTYYEQNISSAVNGVLEYVTDYSEPKIFKSLSNQTFDAFDCLTIGKHSFINRDYSYAYNWFKEGLNKIDSQTTPQIKDELHQYYSDVFRKILQSLKLPSKVTEVRKLNKNETNDGYYKKDLLQTNDDLCLGRKLMNISYESKLKCFYLNTTLKPFLRLTRVRVEELYKRPQIVLIHNFWSPKEAETVINSTQYSLETITKSNVWREQIRYSAENFTFDQEFQRISQIYNRRMNAITNTYMNIFTPRFNAVRYQVGGFHQIHSNSKPFVIVSAITYLNDVAAGGATVVPWFNVTVFPEKYAALIWHYLSKSGEMLETTHTGCPVLYGQKWMTTSLSNVKEHIFDKCALDKQEQYSL